MTLDSRSIKFDHTFGNQFAKGKNLHYIDKNVVLFAAGNVVVVHDFESEKRLGKKSQNVIFGRDGGGIGAICVHPSKKLFAVAERGVNPNIYVYDYPGCELQYTLENGTERAYSDVSFSDDGERMASVGSFPDYLLTVWDWKNCSIVLRTKAFSQEVYNVSFAPGDAGRLTTSGTGHIRFWKMASTFTGLKLQGDIGKFGKVELSDIVGYAELPDGKVLSGSERGSLLLWEGNFIKTEIEREEGGFPHQGPVDCVLLEMEKNRFATGGHDGYIRFWDYDAIDNAELEEFQSTVSAPCLGELKVSGNDDDLVIIKSMLPTPEGDWIVQDARGKIWVVNEESKTSRVIFSGHAGAVAGVAVSPIDHFAATAGQDSTIKLWDYVDKNMIFSAEYNCPASSILWVPTTVDSKARSVLVGFEDGVIRVVYRAYNGWKKSHVFKPHNGPIKFMEFSPCGKFLATYGEDSKLFIFNVEKIEGRIGHDSKTKYEPMCFYKMKKGAKSMCWRNDSRALLFATEDGVVEISKPRTELDISETYETQLDSREWTFARRPVLKKKAESPKSADDNSDPSSSESKENPSEEDESEEEEAPLGKPLCAIYASSEAHDQFLLALDGADSDVLHYCDFEGEFPDQELPLVVSPSRMSRSSSGKILLCLDNKGGISLRPQESLSVEPLRVIPHDSHAGGVTGAWTSFDDEYLLSTGFDGQLLSYRLSTSTFFTQINEGDEPKAIEDITFNDISSSFPTDGRKHNKVQEDSMREAIDILEESAYSIEEDKKRSEADTKSNQAEVKKRVVRRQIEKLIAELGDVLKQNDDLPKESRLSDEELCVDLEYQKMLEQDGARLQEEVDRVMQWRTEKSRIGLQKLETRYLSHILFEAAKLSAIEQDVIVQAFEAEVYDEKNGVSAPTELLVANEMTNGTSNDTETNHIIADDSELQAEEGRVAEKEVKKSTFEIRKARRLERKAGIARLMAEKPDENTEDAEDLKTIQDAITNRGDYKLKTASDYVPPDGKRVNGEAKEKQLNDLKDNVHSIVMGFNEKFAALRDRKKEIIETCTENTAKVELIGERLSREAPIIVSQSSSMVNPAEYPSNRKIVTDAQVKLRQEQQKLANELKGEHKWKEGNDLPKIDGKDAIDLASAKSILEDGKESNEQNSFVSFGPDKMKFFPIGDKICVESGYSSVSFAKACLNLTNDQELSALEAREKQVLDTLLDSEIKELSVAPREQVVQFDRELQDLEYERLQIENFLKSAEMKKLSLEKELELLLGFEKKDNMLATKLNKCSRDQQQAQKAMEQYKASLTTEQANLKTLEVEESDILETFDGFVSTDSPFKDALWKIFKRKIKRNKNTNGDEDSDEESDESDFDDSDWESDDEDEEGEVCPIGCQETLYDQILELREKRLDVEEKRTAQEKKIDDLRKSIERQTNRLKSIDRDLKATEVSVQALRAEKQAAMNEVETYVLLNGSQIRYDDNEEAEALKIDEMPEVSALPESLEEALVFSNNKLSGLSSRVVSLNSENQEYKQEFRNLHKEQSRIHRTLSQKKGVIANLNARCEDLQMLKFGQVISLDSLDQMTTSKSLEDMDRKIASEEVSAQQESQSIEKQQRLAERDLLVVVKENTALLNEVGVLTDKHFKLEKALEGSSNSGSQIHISDNGPIRAQQAGERRRLVQLVRLQSKEIDALKQEIAVLRRKGGHVYLNFTPQASSISNHQ
eukprot:TRINITY_DN2297_c1_g1_i1.p1 TRINITY_DN2297_c1_g1~~TRINITY_DN2297_c1_g1_i1.p1  ORF type:complete len:1707 (+),score=573.01 TRINITY_DN2297_c1_g1_i1:171-5291(+)